MNDGQLKATRLEFSKVGTHTAAMILAHLDCNGQLRIFTQGDNQPLSMLALAAQGFVQDRIWGKDKKTEKIETDGGPKPLLEVLPDSPKDEKENKE